MKKRSLFALLFLAGPAGAEQHRSAVSLGMETGLASSSLGGSHDAGRLHGGRIKYDITPRWAAAARFQSRTFKMKKDQSQRSVIRPVTAVGSYNFMEPGAWAPYGFVELGLSHNRRTVGSVTRSASKPAMGLGAGVELKLLAINALSLELAHRRFAGGSASGHQVTENAVAVGLHFYIPDEWIPIRSKLPVHIPDMDDPVEASRARQLPLADAEKRMAQEELDKVQQDIQDRKIPPIHCETGQAVLLQASHETLDIVGTILRRYPNLSVLITGHTDEVGTPEDNSILGQARAELVRTYLIQNFGLTAEKLTAEGAGETRPAADNATDQGRFLNRRVEFTILP